ncbi:hypothetical protein DFH09DRAFT_1332251 [Mycena vulgaris]|nr:hypothetical protein DFH09DRAFT_1332251 [Mycena vulgaris]
MQRRSSRAQAALAQTSSVHERAQMRSRRQTGIAAYEDLESALNEVSTPPFCTRAQMPRRCGRVARREWPQQPSHSAEWLAPLGRKIVLRPLVASCARLARWARRTAARPCLYALCSGGTRRARAWSAREVGVRALRCVGCGGDGCGASRRVLGLAQGCSARRDTRAVRASAAVRGRESRIRGTRRGGSASAASSSRGRRAAHPRGAARPRGAKVGGSRGNAERARSSGLAAHAAVLSVGRGVAGTRVTRRASGDIAKGRALDEDETCRPASIPCARHEFSVRARISCCTSLVSLLLIDRLVARTNE